MTPAELRAALPRAWPAFLARFPTPTPVQLEAATSILAGRDTLLCAPTASGKTEAYLAPVTERVRPGPTGEPRVLLVSPTRALVNDLHRRIEGPLSAMNLDCGRWTGDQHDRGRLHAVTLLTPEGLDSRLSRAGKALEGVQALVLDELHVVDDTARGDQLLMLVERLRARAKVQVLAASATVPDPAALAGRYLHDGVVVSAPGKRKVIAHIEPSRSPVALSRRLFEFAEAGLRKVLVFCDKRDEVEILVRAIRGRPPFGSAVFAHHGSMAKNSRLSTEAQFLAAPSAMCVATGTMELGIDIGNIDLVVLNGPPPDLPSLLQRIGRGGRRADGVHVLCLANGPFQVSVFRTLLATQRDGGWHHEQPTFRAGVLVQQAISSLHERPSRTIDAAAMHRRLPRWLREAWPPERLDAVLLRMAERDLLSRPANGRYGLGGKAEAMWARGRLHANIEDRAGVAVVDSLTGDTVGHVVDASIPALNLAGRARRVVIATEKRVVTESTGAWDLPNFGGGPPRPTGPALATALLVGAGIPVPSLCRVGDGVAFFHGLGTAGGLLAAAVLKAAGAKVARPGRFAVLLEEAPDNWPRPESVAGALATAHAAIARELDLGAWHNRLPAAEQREVVGRRARLDLVEAAFLHRPPTAEVADEELWNEAVWA